jgi:DNA-binding CsgD family transcriptional regulator
VAVLLERDAELAELAGLLDSALAGRGGVAVVQGSPGIGKTRVLDELTANARRRGLTVLRATGGELEQEFPYGVVRQLLDPVLHGERGAEELLEGAARLVLPALSFASGDDAAPSEAAILHGLYWLVAGLAARGPLLLAVDDAQWADTPSLRAAVYLARRVGDLPIALMLAMRRVDVSAPDRLLTELVDGRAVLDLAPLTEAGVAALIEAVTGAEVAPAFAAAVCAATGGNPFLTVELIRAAAAEGLEPTAEAVARLGVLATAGVDRSVRRRLARLAPAAVALARAVAVLGDDADLRHAAMLADVDERAAARAAASLAAADVLERGASLRFVHALVRASVTNDAGDAVLDVLHARAARLLDADGAIAARVAAHILASTPRGDPWAVEVLRRAAREALAQGAPQPAVRSLRRALEEPPKPELRGQVLLELGLAETHADSSAGVGHLSEAYAALVEPEARTTAALARAQTLLVLMRPGEAVDVLLTELDAAERCDHELAFRIAAQIAIATRVTMGGRSSARERIKRLAQDATGASDGERRLLAALADEELGTSASATATAELANRLLGLHGGVKAWRPVGPQASAMVSLLVADRLDVVTERIEPAIAEAQEIGSAVGFQHGVGLRGYCRWQEGDLKRAEADLRASFETGQEFGNQFPPFVAGLVGVLVERGELAEADQLLVECGLAGAMPQVMLFNPLLFHRAELRRAQGRRGEAIADGREAGDRYLASGITRPVPPWRSALALVLAPDAREEALALAHEEVEAAAAWGTPRSIGLAGHRLGLIEGAPAGEERIRAAIATLEGSPARLELAHALVDLGAIVRRRRASAEARPWLERGMELAHACGATRLAEHARTELAATGVRPRRAARTGRDALTASELRVAELAASGLTNRTIAQSLFVTQRTVETHLGHVYQKLGHSSRERLQEDLGRGG